MRVANVLSTHLGLTGNPIRICI